MSHSTALNHRSGASSARRPLDAARRAAPRSRSALVPGSSGRRGRAWPSTLLAALAIVPLALACDAAASDEVTPPETALTGMYTIASWTKNSDGCAGEGPATGETTLRPFFGIAPDASAFLRMSWVFAFACSSEADCAARQHGGTVIGLLPHAWRLADGDDATGWRGTSEGAYREMDDESCTGFRTTARLTGATGAVRLELRTEYVTWEDGGGTGPCAVERVAELATGTCGELEVITATYTQALPPASEQD